MPKYFIESAKFGSTPDGAACGPVSGVSIAEVKVKTESGETFYMSMADVEGMPNIYKTEESTFDFQLTADPDTDQAKFDELNTHYVEIASYDEIFENTDDEYRPIYRYLTYLVLSIEEDCQKLIQASVGKWTDEFEIPYTSTESDYWNDSENILQNPEIKELIQKYNNGELSHATLFEVPGYYFTIEKDSIKLVEDIIYDSPKGTNIELESGLESEEKEFVDALMNELSIDQDYFKDLGYTADFSEDEIIENFDDESPEDLEIFHKIQEKLHEDGCPFDSIEDLVSAFERYDLEDGGRYYKLEGDYIDLDEDLDENSIDIDEMGDITVEEWIDILKHLDKYAVE